MVGAPDVLLRTERIVLRPWRVEEADRFYDLYRRDEVVRWLSGRPVESREQAVTLIERRAATLAAEPGFGGWAIVEQDTGIPAGTVLLQRLPDGDGEVEIGWHLHPDRWGHGLVTEAATALLAHAWAVDVPEVWAVTHPDNHRSQAVCQRIGLRCLGTTHRWYHELSTLFWIGATPDQTPSIAPDAGA